MCITMFLYLVITVSNKSINLSCGFMFVQKTINDAHYRLQRSKFIVYKK